METEGREAVPHRRAAARDAGSSPRGNHEAVGVFGDEDEEEAAEEPGARVPGYPGAAEAEGTLPGPNTCCICWAPWAASGAHRICCIPCGHVYGRSCLFRWLIQCGGSVAKCPRCREEFNSKHILNLYTTKEHLWDDCHHEQATRPAAAEEDATQEVIEDAMEAIADTTQEVIEDAMEAIAHRDEVIAQMGEKIAWKDEVIAQMGERIAWRDEVITQMTLIHESTEIPETKRLMAHIVVLSVVLCLLLVAMVAKKW